MDWHVTLWLPYRLARIQDSHVAAYHSHCGNTIDF